jgi:hypothetical protein
VYSPGTATVGIPAPNGQYTLTLPQGCCVPTTAPPSQKYLWGVQKGDASSACQHASCPFCAQQETNSCPSHNLKYRTNDRPHHDHDRAGHTRPSWSHQRLLPYPARHKPEHVGLCSWETLPKVPRGHGDFTPETQKDPGSHGLLVVWWFALPDRAGSV